MKIAVIGAKGLPPKQGGIEHYCAEVYPRMVAQGHSVDLFARSSYTDCSWVDNYDYKGVRVISLPGGQLRGVDAFITSGLAALAATGKKYDIVHFHALGPSLFTCLPNIATSAKVVVTCQGLDWQRAKWGSFSTRLIQLGEKAAVRFADGFIVVSDALKSTFGKLTIAKQYTSPTLRLVTLILTPILPTAPNWVWNGDAILYFWADLYPKNVPTCWLKPFLP